ncbi:MAG: hypothetical protein A2Z76_03940 [Chloroflexi bacterium RBG_13_56_8b]|nr:MAG: hypothetical protein A2Z76_03940 [Chloroflexi bacterium RBG_13_56_8b]
MLNQALELEQAARIQYMAHAEQATTPAVIARLKEIAGDEKEHEELFREMIGSYLEAVPAMSIAETHPAKTEKDMLKVNLADEKHAVDFYSGIMDKLKTMNKELKYEYLQLEHSLRHVIMDEQEHIVELKLLMRR